MTRMFTANDEVKDNKDDDYVMAKLMVTRMMSSDVKVNDEEEED